MDAIEAAAAELAATKRIVRALKLLPPDAAARVLERVATSYLEPQPKPATVAEAVKEHTDKPVKVTKFGNGGAIIDEE